MTVNHLIFRLQNLTHLAHGETACPDAIVDERDVMLSYEPGDSAAIRFIDVACFRVGDPNDEGFFGGGATGIFNDSIYCWKDFPKLTFGYFYEVLGFDWSSGLVGEGITELTARANWPSLDLRHFAYFMKNGTFECLCKSWHEL